MLGLLPYLLAGALVAGIWIWDKATIASLRSQVTSLQTEIDNPETGWRRQLSVCTLNTSRTDAALELVNAKVDQLGLATALIAKDQEKLGKSAQRDGQITRDVVMNTLKQPVQGDTSCERALNVLRAPLPRF